MFPVAADLFLFGPNQFPLLFCCPRAHTKLLLVLLEPSPQTLFLETHPACRRLRHCKLHLDNYVPRTVAQTGQSQVPSAFLHCRITFGNGLVLATPSRSQSSRCVCFTKSRCTVCSCFNRQTFHCIFTAEEDG